MPDDLFGVDRLAVDDCGDLAVRPTGVEADAAAFHVTADPDRRVVLLGEVFGAAVDDFKAGLEYVRHKLHIKPALTLFRLRQDIFRLHPLAQGACATQIDPEAANGPQ